MAGGRSRGGGQVEDVETHTAMHPTTSTAATQPTPAPRAPQTQHTFRMRSCCANAPSASCRSCGGIAAQAAASACSRSISWTCGRMEMRVCVWWWGGVMGVVPCMCGEIKIETFRLLVGRSFKCSRGRQNQSQPRVRPCQLHSRYLQHLLLCSSTQKLTTLPLLTYIQCRNTTLLHHTLGRVPSASCSAMPQSHAMQQQCNSNATHLGQGVQRLLQQVLAVVEHDVDELWWRRKGWLGGLVGGLRAGGGWVAVPVGV